MSRRFRRLVVMLAVTLLVVVPLRANDAVNMSIDTSSGANVAGWAVVAIGCGDCGSLPSSGVDNVAIWAYNGSNWSFWGNATLGIARTDIEAIYGVPDAGWSLYAPLLGCGGCQYPPTFTVCAYVRSAATQQYVESQCRDFTLQN